MQDRFKFRAWIKTEKRYGYLLNLFNCGANSKQYEVEEYDEQGDSYTVYSSDEVVLQQCTGLKDKNGKLIYEGDILCALCTGAHIGVVCWDTKKANYRISGKGFAYNALQGLHSELAFEVIGNIYENPELLEERC